MLTRFAAGALAAASISTLAVAAEAGTKRPVRWVSGGAVWTTKSKAFKKFFKNGEITDRALEAGINNSGWTADEIQEGMTKTYEVDLVGVSRFLYSKDGVKFLKDQTRSYFPYWQKKKTAVVALRSAIILDAADGKISSAGIMKQLPVAFRLNDNGSSDGSQNVCKDGLDGAQATSLLSWYVFLPACVQANQILPAAPAPRSAAPVRGLW
ncbi:putative conserved secreted protein [Synechococcus sp. PROS-7-1]|uniref:alpha/beta hydrolase n=1 Tax=Synechococcus sp. PROS-7-1 TaxID=1442556 RepID=UPI001647FCA6|nr:alpha/beta hydrolase [Synechococcus sp. PROS-7-1]QNI86224.1 putative conserved secreted protein [Synechococcus sp. PROS-7-1]